MLIRTSKNRLVLSRRTFLRGLGAAVALPWLEAMAPSKAFAAEGTPPVRLLFMYVPNGIHMPAWTPATEGAGFEMTPILSPLASLQSKLSVLTGLVNLPAYPEQAGDHAAGTGAFLTCTHVKKTEGADIQNNISVDQVAANAMGEATSLRSLEIGLDSGSSVGGCDSGYSCAYTSNISWAGPQTPVAKATSPQVVFDRLFTDGGATLTPEQKARRKSQRLSILDAVWADAKGLQSKLGVSDSFKVEEYLVGVDELEKRIQKEVTDNCVVPDRPEGPWTVQERAALMNELLALSIQCDHTRFATYMLANAATGRVYDFLGVSGQHHETSHHQGDPLKQADLTTIATWEVAQYADLLTRLEGTAEGDGTVLDNCLVLFSSEVEDGNTHSHKNLPVLVAGGGGGAITPGQHRIWTPDSETPIANLFLTMLHAAGVPEESFGDSTGLLDLS